MYYVIIGFKKKNKSVSKPPARQDIDQPGIKNTTKFLYFIY